MGFFPSFVMVIFLIVLATGSLENTSNNQVPIQVNNTTDNVSNIATASPIDNGALYRAIIPAIIIVSLAGLAAYLIYTGAREVRKKPISQDYKIMFSSVLVVIIIAIIDMSGLLTLPNSTSLPTWIYTIATMVLLFVTINYVTATEKLVEATKKGLEFQTAPRIFVMIKQGDEIARFIDLVIENKGQGEAKNITFIVAPDFETVSGFLTKEYEIFKKGLPYMAPGQRFFFTLTDLGENYDEKKDMSFTITVRYHDIEGTEYIDSYLIDLSIFHGFRFWGEFEPGIV